MPKVDINGVGVVQFPDDWAPEKIQYAIENDIIPRVKGAAPAKSSGVMDVVKEVGRQGALTAREGLEGLAGIVAPFANAAGAAFNKVTAGPGELVEAATGAKLPAQYQNADLVGAVSSVLDRLGVAKPQTGTERVVGDINRGVIGAAGGVGAGQAIARGAVAGGEAAGAALSARPALQGASGAAAGGAAGAAREGGGDTVDQILAGLAGGVLAPAASVALTEIAKRAGLSVAQLLKPFTESGRLDVVGATLRRLAANPAQAAGALADVPEHVPGSLPTTAQAARDPGLLQAERALAAAKPEFAVRKSQNNTARNAALDTVARTPDDLKTAVKDRGVNANANYGRALDETPSATPQVVAELEALQSRPSFVEAMRQGARLMREQGEEVPTLGKSRAPRTAGGIDLDKDDIVAAVRKLGGINADDEAVGSLAKLMPFQPDRSGAVFRVQAFGGSSNRTNTASGHSLDEMARKLYEKGYLESPEPSDVLDRLFESSKGTGQYYSTFKGGQTSDPLQAAIEALTAKIGAKGEAAGPRVDFLGGGTKLAHYTKLALDDMIDQAMRSGSGNQARALIGTRDKLVGLMESSDFSPSYRAARESYKADSVPIDRMEIGQQIQRDTRLPGPDVTGEAILSQPRWQRVVTAKLGELGKKLSPEEVDTLKRIGADLDRASFSDTAGRAVGSNTFQNLSVANVIGAGFGDKVSSSPLWQTALRPLQWLYKLPEAKVQDLLTQAMLDPTLARVMMSKANPRDIAFLADVLRDQARAIGLGGTQGATEAPTRRAESAATQ